MRKLWFLMVLAGCVEDVATAEQAVTATYDVCTTARACTKCWIDDMAREICAKSVDFTAHRGIDNTAVVFSNRETGEVALWSLTNGWRALSPTEIGAGALGPRDFAGDGSRRFSTTTLEQGVKSPRDAASGLATGRRQHRPLTLTMELGRFRADLDGDRADDLVWSNSKGEVEIGFVKRDVNETVDSSRALAGWTLVGAGDFDGTKTSDLVWRKGSALRIRSMAGARIIAERDETVDATWTFIGAADLDRDTRADILWRDAKGGLIVWPSGESTRAVKQTLDPELRIEALQDLDGDGSVDVLARDDVKKASRVYVLRGTVWTATNGGVTHEDVWNAQS